MLKTIMLIATMFVATIMALMIATGRCGALPPIDPGLPTPPPPLPTQVVNGDGTRMTCNPSGTYCWEAKP